MKRSIITLLITWLFCQSVFAATPTWTVNPSDYSNSMVMVGVLNINGTESPDENDLIAAFVGSEVRGVANVQYVSSIDRYIAYLLVYSNTSGEALTFKMYDASEDLEIAAQNTEDFATNGALGNLGSPFIWSDVLLNTDAELLTFSFADEVAAAVIDLNEVSITVAAGTDDTSLVASFTTSNGARVSVGGVSQTAGVTSNNFSSPVDYVVTSEDGKHTATYAINVTVINNPPTDLGLSLNSISENSAANTTVGTLTATDDGGNHSFSLVEGEGDDNNDLFEVFSGAIRAKASFDYEIKNSYSIRLMVTDDAAQTFEKTLIILVSDVNETPTDITLSQQTIGENSLAGAQVATLSTNDPDNGDSFNYTLSGGLSDNNGFSIDGTNLQSNTSFDFENKNSYSIELTVTDGGLNTFVKSFTIDVTDANDVPTSIELDNQSVSENVPFGTVIGNLSATDQDANDVQQFSLIAGTGDTDNSKVLISGSQVLVNTTLDFETTDAFSIRVEVEDAAAATFEETFMVSVLDANDAPADLVLSATTLPENSPANTIVGGLSVVDDGGNHTFSLAVGDGDQHNMLFEVSGNDLQVKSALDFESQDTFSIRLMVSDDGGLTFEKAFTIQLTDVNESPTEINLDNTIVTENGAVGTVVALLSATDPDNGETFTYSLSGGLSGNSNFSINGNMLETGTSFDFENKNSHSLEITVTDGGSNTFSQVVEITVADENEAPTDIQMDNQSVFENLTFGTLIGTLSASDQDVNDVQQYALVAGEGDANNAMVLISGDQVLLNSALDFESQSEFSVRIQVKDGGDATYEEMFAISVMDANDPPTDLGLTANTFPENSPANSVIGNLTVADNGGPHTFSLVAGVGDTDNASFEINTNELLSKNEFDFELKSVYSIRLRVTDDAGMVFEKALTIQVTNRNDAPSGLSLSKTSIDENNATGSVVATLSATDQDEGDSFTYSLTGGLADNTNFSIEGSNLLTASSFDFENKASHSIEITVTDAGSSTFSKTIEITVEDLNEAPSDIQMDNQSVFESLTFGTLIGTLSAADQDINDVLQYALIAGEGDTGNAMVLIAGDQVVLNSALDFESQSEFSIRIQVKDGGDATFEEMFTISVLDANDPPTDLVLTANTIPENSQANTIVGGLSVVDDGGSHTFSLAVGDGDEDNALFEVSEDDLKAKSGLDFESQNTYSIRLMVTDDADQTFEKSMTITVTDVNEAPSDIQLSKESIAENEPPGTVFAVLSNTDPDNAETFTYALTGGLADNSSFSLNEDTLVTASTFDFEAQSSFTIEVTVTDGGDNTHAETFFLTVLNQNEAPTAVAMDSQEVFENLPFGTVIGTLSASDQDVGDVQQYSLVSGDGDTDNASVLISGSQVLVNETLDFETQSELSIRLEVRDQNSASYEKRFSISILDVNDSPTDLLLSNASVIENEAVGFVVGSFSVLDADPTAMIYSFVDGQNDNSSFTIEGDEIKLAIGADFETQNQFTIDVLAVDIDDQSVANRFTLQVMDENEAPEVINPIGAISKAANTNIELPISGVFQDVDAGDELTLSVHVPASATLPEGVLFDASASKITLNSALMLTNFELVLTATDIGGLLARDTVDVSAEVLVPLGSNDYPASVSIFPNPVKSRLNLVVSDIGSIIIENANVWNINGKLIRRDLRIINTQIQVEGLPRGVYLLELKTNDKPMVLRFIKE